MAASYYLTPELYDLVYRGFDFDVAPLVASARAADGPVLELCCGNGRVLVPVLEAGVDADGVDLDPAMLADLRAKLAARGLQADLHLDDMRTFSLPRRYRLIVITFNSFLHNLSQDDQLTTLRACGRHLEPGGALHLVVFHPSAPALVESAAGERFFRELPLPDGSGRLRMFDRIAPEDRIEQIRHVTRRLEFLDDAGAVRETREGRFAIRYVFKPEMELLLRVAGFARWQVEPLGRPATDDAGRALREGDTLLWTAWND